MAPVLLIHVFEVNGEYRCHSSDYSDGSRFLP